MGSHHTNEDRNSDWPDQTPMVKLWEKFDYLCRIESDLRADRAGAELNPRWQVSQHRLDDVFFDPITREKARLVVLAASTPSQSTDDVRLKAKMLSERLEKDTATATTALARSLVDDILAHH